MSPSLLPTPWQNPWSGDHPAQWWPRAPRGATWSCPRWARAPWRSPGFPGAAGGLCTARTRSRSCQAWVRATPWQELGRFKRQLNSSWKPYCVTHFDGHQFHSIFQDEAQAGFGKLRKEFNLWKGFTWREKSRPEDMKLQHAPVDRRVSTCLTSAG